MKLKKFLIPAILILIPLLFFYKTVVFGQVPFPGDLLVANYEPYKSLIVGVPHKGQGSDVLRQLYPWKYYSIELLKQGTFPLWDPYIFSGNPHFAALQSGVFNPINILFFVLPFISAWSIYIILQYVFMMVATYLYLRQIKLSKIPSLFGAVAFSFSGFITVWAWYGTIGHTLVFLPFTLYLIEKLFTKPKWYLYLLLVLSLALSIFVGYVQLAMYIYILAGVYVLARYLSVPKKHTRGMILILLCFVGGILISAIQLVPLFELVRLSLRSNYSYNVLLERLMPPENFITLFVPDFFGNSATLNYFLRGGSNLERASNIGVWPLVFAFFAVFTKRTFHKTFFIISTILIYVSTLSIPPIAYFHSIGIPFLSTGIPTRVLSVFIFCVAVLGAIGLQAFLDNKNKKRLIVTIVIFAVFFAVLWVTVYVLKNPVYAISRKNLILPTGVFVLGAVLILSKVPKKIVAAIMILLTIGELFYGFQKFNSFVSSAYVYPQTQIVKTLHNIQGIDRYWGYGSASIDANFQLVDKNYTTDGYDPLFSKRYGEFLSASENGSVTPEVPKSVANIFKGYGTNDLKNNPNRIRALSLTGVKYVLNKKEDPGVDSAFSEDNFKLINQQDDWQIYQNKNVLPRIALFGSYRVEDSSKKIIDTLYDPNFDFQKTVIIEDQLPEGYYIKPDSKKSMYDILYTPNQITLKTNSTQDQLLFISDNFFPGWKATVNGEDTQIIRANYTFRAVPLKAGTNSVRLYYSPESFRIGLWISIFSLTTLIVVFVWLTISRRHGKKSK